MNGIVCMNVKYRKVEKNFFFRKIYRISGQPLMRDSASISRPAGPTSPCLGEFALSRMHAK